jgi:hypothetical protein
MTYGYDILELCLKYTTAPASELSFALAQRRHDVGHTPVEILARALGYEGV